MDIGGIAVIGRSHRDDRLQRRGLARGDLQPVEATPTDADHRHLPVAPVLPRQPVDGIDTVKLFLNAVFVGDGAFAVAGAANVQPQAGIAVPGKIAVHLFVARAGAVALAVGQVFQDQRHLSSTFRQPEATGEPGAVGHENPDVLDLGQGEGKLGAGGHGLVSAFRLVCPVCTADRPPHPIPPPQEGRGARADQRVLTCNR